MGSSLLFLLFVYYFCSNFFLVTSNITINRFLNNSETIVSSDGRFKMGFFSPGNSTNRYVGIWYNIKDFDSKEVVWVANGNNPVNDNLSVLKISKDGNLQLSDGEEMVLWSSNVSYLDNTTIAELRDTGNLVLLSSASGKIVWQSFEHVTNTLLPLMTISINMSLDHNLYKDEFDLLRSWKSASDPSDGQFAMRLTPSLNTTEFVVVKEGELYWRTGPWNGRNFLGVPLMVEQMIHMLYKDTENTLDVLYSPANESMLEHLVLDYDGNFVLRKWDNDSLNMTTFWGSIQSECDIFGKCGPFGRCNSKDSPICNCLNGFRPKNINEWSKGNWTSGCVRKTPLQCGNIRDKDDGFLRLQHMKLPFHISSFPFAKDHDDCRRTCLENCTCLAYAYPEGLYRKSYGCMIWDASLIDIQVFSSDGADLFIRLAHSEIVEMRNNNTKIIVIAVTTAIVATIFVVFGSCFWSRICGRCVTSIDANSVVDQDEFKDLTMFKFKDMEFATINFSEFNKLGEGGFGPVYKGKLENGQEIAVKRLSRTSGQGLQEFMNEVIMISKLQHKNLVRLLGCCIERDEKLLIYEFMPNRSLDALLFDSHHKKQLDWKKRLNIVNGVCRGLLYLHRDSRLKIIHRDLKASNILLDEELNAKISDFGMARIFETKQDQANTIKVVGTYGYMSPEYAMEGTYSEKSDVYSLGVLLLEIVSGRKNSSFRNYESLGLLAHTWKLWNENDIQSLIDPTILDASSKDEILKCIHLGLLSVQENPKHRPTASALVLMLDVNDIMELPYPTQPGYIQSAEEQGSVNHISLTTISGR